MTVLVDRRVAATRPAYPYPGLRPFEPDEWSIFFGREAMIDELIERLAAQRFVLIHGASGSGKSSLVRAGVLPKLARLHARHGTAWLTCAMRPSGGPLWNLAAEFARLEGRADAVTRIGEIIRLFNRRGARLSDIIDSLDAFKGKRVCLLVDQFEELFRFERETSREEAELFVDLLINEVRPQTDATDEPEAEAARTSEPEEPHNLHIILTMRSEFLGDCARFDGFAEAINRTQYLVPRLTRDGLLRAIRRPAELYNGEVTLELAERLIADVRGQMDELPLIQHGLMLFWHERSQPTAPGEKIVLDADMLDQATSLAKLLSDHADRIMKEATPEATKESRTSLFGKIWRVVSRSPKRSDMQERAGAVAIERLFRALTDINADGQAIRRPQTFRDLVAVCGVAPDVLRAIIDAFRAERVSFITPYMPRSINETTIIDISHESLIRSWEKIADPESGWLRQEFEDGLVWRSLLLEAKAFLRDTRRVLSGVTTTERRKWLKQKTPAWSRRYGNRWPLVELLLKVSRRAIKRRRRWLSLVMAPFLILPTFGIYLFSNTFAVARQTYQGYQLNAWICLAVFAILGLWMAITAILLGIDYATQFIGFLRRVGKKSSVDTTPLDAMPHQNVAPDTFDPRSHIRRSAVIGVSLAGLAIIAGVAGYYLGVKSLGQPLYGHQGEVYSVAFSPDSKVLASASGDTTIKLWDVAKKQLLRTLGGHIGPVNAVAFSPDGHSLASAGSDKTIKLWDVTSGHLLRTLSGHADIITTIAFSTAGDIIASADRSGAIKIWSVADGTSLRTIDNEGNSIWSLAFIPKTQLLVSGDTDNEVEIWDTADGKLVHTLADQSGWVTSIAVSPDGSTLISGSRDSRVRLWDWQNQKLLEFFWGHSNWVNSVAFAPDGKFFASGSADDSIKFWDTATRSYLRTITGSSSAINSIAFSPDGHWLAAGCADKTVRLWDMNDLK